MLEIPVSLFCWAVVHILDPSPWEFKTSLVYYKVSSWIARTFTQRKQTKKVSSLNKLLKLLDANQLQWHYIEVCLPSQVFATEMV